MTALEPQVVERPGGTAYRARKPPEAIRVHLCGYGPGILVLRCHDLDVALEAIGNAVDAGVLTRDMFPPAVPAGIGVLGGLPGAALWVRWVPDEFPPGPETGGVWERELRGTAGATPAVLFAAEATR